MKKQLRECRTQEEIKKRLKLNAGILLEAKQEDEDLEISGMSVGDLKNLIRDIVSDIVNEPDNDEYNLDEELNNILSELELEL